MSANLSDLVQQKIKYWTKTLSNDAIVSNLGKTVDTYDPTINISDIVINTSLFSSLTGTFNLGLSLSELAPWNISFNASLPDPEFVAKGVMLDIEPMSIDDIISSNFPQFEDIMLKSVYSALDFMDIFLSPEFSSGAKQSIVQKGYYDQATFGNAYYDPAAVREFFRSSIFAFFNKQAAIEKAKNMIESVSNTLEINSEVVRNIFDRTSMVNSVRLQALTWDYGWWDYSCFSKEGSPGEVTFKNFDLADTTVEYEDLIDASACGYWDEYPWDGYYWCDVIHPYNITPVALPAIADAISANFKTRFILTPLAVANYQTGEERQTWYKSSRVETYAMPMSQRYQIEMTVKNTLNNISPGLDPIKIRMYVSAILQLFSIMGSQHGWGKEALKSMTKDELLQWWTDTWSKEGLDPNILTRLYNVVSKQLDAYSDARIDLSLRSLRNKLRNKIKR